MEFNTVAQMTEYNNRHLNLKKKIYFTVTLTACYICVRSINDGRHIDNAKLASFLLNAHVAEAELASRVARSG